MVVLEGLLGGALAGGALAGGLGGIFGRSKRTGFGKAFNRSQFFLDLNAQRATSRARQFGPGLFQSIAALNPLFGKLQDRAISDLDDEGRGARLANALESRLGQAQSARGVFRSPTSALRTSFAGVQLEESVRQQSLSNALSVFQAGQSILGPTLTQLGFATPPNPGIGFDQLSLQVQGQNAQNQSIFGAIGQGFSAGLGVVADQRRQTFQDRLLKAFENNN